VPPEEPDGEPGEAAELARAAEVPFYEPAEVEAVFTDAAGRFESGPLWPGCVYTLTVSADGFAPRQLREIEGRAGQVHEVRSVALSGTSATVAGTVVGPDGRPLGGATVINSGDGPKRLTVLTDAAGRFSLTGLYDGPAVVVAHKPGYRWGYAVARPGAPEPKVILRPLSDPPGAVAVPTDDQRRAEADLVRRLTELARKGHAQPPPPPPQDPWAEARTDLDGYLAKLAKQESMTANQTLTALARVLAKEDRAKAVLVLQGAAAAARRLSMPRQPAMAGFAGLAFDVDGGLRVDALTRVAETADDLGLRAEAAAWLTEAEAMAGRLPEAQRQQALGTVAIGWVRLDPARTEKLLAAAGPELITGDMAVAGVVGRLVRDDPAKAVPWLSRFKRPTDPIAQSYRSQVAVRLAGRDLPQAVRVGEGAVDPAYRALTLARLATATGADRKLARGLIEKAAAAIAAGPGSEEDEPEQRLGVAVYLLWQAQAVAYPDLASLVAVALTTRPPVPAHEYQATTWRSQTLRLAAGVGSIDPAAGRALLGPDPGRDGPHAEDDGEGDGAWFIALALADPAAASRHVGDDLGPDEAAGALAVLRRRSAVLDRFGMLERLWWVREGPEADAGED
jgi:hypothetical protein